MGEVQRSNSKMSPSLLPRVVPNQVILQWVEWADKDYSCAAASGTLLPETIEIVSCLLSNI